MRKVRLLAEYSSPSLLHNFLIVLIISCDTLLLPNNFSINSDQEGKQSMLAWQCIIVWKLMRLLYVCVLLVLDRCTHLSTTPFKVSLACVLETLDYSPKHPKPSFFHVFHSLLKKLILYFQYLYFICAETLCYWLDHTQFWILGVHPFHTLPTQGCVPSRSCQPLWRHYCIKGMYTCIVKIPLLE